MTLICSSKNVFEGMTNELGERHGYRAAADVTARPRDTQRDCTHLLEKNSSIDKSRAGHEKSSASTRNNLLAGLAGILAGCSAGQQSSGENLIAKLTFQRDHAVGAGQVSH